jgi:hypothetical protein
VFGRVAEYDVVNDADRLGHDPAMLWIVGYRVVADQAASTSQMGRSEAEVLNIGLKESTAARRMPRREESYSHIGIDC